MYHIYEVVTQNTGFKWHLYAESSDNACKMADCLNHNATKKCRDFAESINYKMIASELKSCNAECDINVKQEVETFFSRFYKPFIKQHGAIGGYVLEYMNCSVNAKVKMPYGVMLNYLDTIWEEPFFISTEIMPVYIADNADYEICIPSYDSKFELVAKLENGHKYETSEAQLRFAGKALGFAVEYKGEDKEADVYILKFKHIQQLCQFLNNFPLVDIDDILCL